MMWKYIARRLLYAIPVLWGVVTVVFILSRLMPGDPVLLYIDAPFQPEEYDFMLHKLGLDQPVMVQYLDYLWNILHLDFGDSISKNMPVLDLLLDKLPPTLILAAFGIFIAIVLAMILGVYTAIHHNTYRDYAGTIFAIFFVSMPQFWLGLMLILLFSVGFNLFPAGGRGTPPDFIHLVLPALTLGLTYAATQMRLTRSSMLEALGQDFVRTARAKGCPRTKVIYHALRNALIPVVTQIGFQLPHAIGALVIIEVIFSYPGFGKLTYDSIVVRDYPALQGCVLIMGFFFVFVNLIVDLLYAVIDPRIKYED